MSILNRPSDGLLSVLLALRRGLIAYGPQPEARLLELCAPASVVLDGKPDMARKTITRWKQLGFFQEVDGQLQMRADIAALGVDDLEGLRTAVLRLVLASENNPLLTSDPDADIDRSLASDCTRATAWALSQDPFSFQAVVGHRAVEALESQQGIEPRLFRNDTRWSGFKEWATFLGIAIPSPKGIVLNPAFSVRSVLSEVFSDSSEIAFGSFLTKLADALPVVDGGAYQVAVQAQISRPWRMDRESEISPCLSTALLTIEASGQLRLEARSDAPQRTLLGRGGRELRPVSHVLRMGVSR